MTNDPNHPRPFIAHNERLIAFCEGVVDIGICGSIETASQAADLIHAEASDFIFKLVRYNLDDHRGEDVSEEVAAAYVHAHFADLDYMGKEHPYIEKSDAYYEFLCETEEAMKDPHFHDPNHEHRTY